MTLQTTLLSRLLLALGVCSVSAFADLVPATPFEVNINGTGFGNVSTLITLQTANGQTTTEAGCIGFGGSTTNCGITTNGKIKNTSTTEPVPTGASASSLRFIFNASEPQGSSITLTQLQTTFYNATGGTVFTANLASAPVILTSTQQGTGNSGFVFMLNGSEASQLQPLLGSVTAIGAGFSATGATGGQDTLFLATAPTVASVPEPSSLILLVSLAGGLLLVARRRTAKT